METDKYQKHFEELLAKCRSYSSNFDEERIKKAWEFAKIAHHGQKRKSGEDFVYHPLQVAIYLASWGLDETAIVAGLLHDSVEDGGATLEDIRNNFGEDVTLLVDGVTKIRTIELRGSKEEIFVENLRKMLLVMSKDLRVVLIKLADRLHNMQTLWALSKKRQLIKAQETLEIYAPIAERLGIGEVKSALEDLAFKYAFPDEYKNLVQKSLPYYKNADKIIKTIRRKILLRLASEKVTAQVHSRKKHLYSLWKKLSRPEINGDFTKIYDIVALRIITKNIPHCYLALGIVHGLYKPVPNIGVSDFIAQPKPNGYQSIHTKVFGPGGTIVEVQIRTEEMHEQAEHGVAAHWAYSERKSEKVSDEKVERGFKADKDKLRWVTELLSWQKEVIDSKEFLRAVKFDALNHRNFIFSPKGDVYDLPSNATPVDFACAVHTKLLHYIKAAKVNGKVVPLKYKLRSGQVVEIVKSKTPRPPNRDWLDFVVTEAARREIRKFFSRHKV